MKMPRKRRNTIEHEFVQFIPNLLEEGKIYVSVEYATAAHNCFCGCGNRVVTPIHPTGWELTFDGDTISLRPSIGNWGFACESHYWISRNQIVWAERMSKADIARGRYRDQELTAAYFDEQNLPTPTPAKRRKKNLFARIFGRQ
jgi:Family of unknown function (DUF6527)